MIPIIMAGGSGTRLWPLSRTAYPKQFLALTGENTLLQQTLVRLDGLNVEKPMVICNEDHRFLVAEQLRQQGKTADILLEPVGRNTAPAIALAALQALEASSSQPSVLLVLAADHMIHDTAVFQEAVNRLLPLVQTGCLATLGIVPTEAATGYGYIRMDVAPNQLPHGVGKVLEFIEKPSEEIAKDYVESGNYLWNSGIFMFRADYYIDGLRKYQPKILEACKKAIAAKKIDNDFIRIDAQAFAECPDDSIDYALMEPLCNELDHSVIVAPLDAGWSDVGSWSALWEISPKDQEGNAVKVGKKLTDADVILQDSKDCLVCANSKLVTLLGVENLVVVDTDDALLIAEKSRVQEIKSIVNNLKSYKRKELINNREVYRPWGKYDSVDQGERYQVKRITVNPGAKLSLQMHHHRAEHWVIVSGTAKVTNGENTFLVTENQSTYIPIGQVHCLENPGVIPLEIIEIQSGAYLGEDDIKRLQDNYGRCL